MDSTALRAAEVSPPTRDWSVAPLSDVIDFILAAYHAPLKTELPRLEAMMRKVHEVHGEDDPGRLKALLGHVLALQVELNAHMDKEEQVLFPMIRRGDGVDAVGLVSVMESDHRDAQSVLREIRALTDDFVTPPDACKTWRALWEGLESLEAALLAHIRIEDEVLQPRALAGA